jgi:hypothetical protein
MQRVRVLGVMNEQVSPPGLFYKALILPDVGFNIGCHHHGAPLYISALI